jgi:hypothetical protein
VQEHDQNTTAEESVDGGGVPAQNLTNDGLMFVLSTDLVESPEDDVQSEDTLGAGENPDTSAEEVIFMTTETGDDPTG